MALIGGCCCWRRGFLMVLAAVVMLSSQSQTDRETRQYAPRYSSDSVHVPHAWHHNASLVTPESAEPLLPAFRQHCTTCKCDCKSMVSSINKQTRCQRSKRLCENATSLCLMMHMILQGCIIWTAETEHETNAAHLNVGQHPNLYQDDSRKT